MQEILDFLTSTDSPSLYSYLSNSTLYLDWIQGYIGNVQQYSDFSNLAELLEFWRYQDYRYQSETATKLTTIYTNVGYISEDITDIAGDTASIEYYVRSLYSRIGTSNEYLKAISELDYSDALSLANTWLASINDWLQRISSSLTTIVDILYDNAQYSILSSIDEQISYLPYYLPKLLSAVQGIEVPDYTGSLADILAALESLSVEVDIPDIDVEIPDYSEVLDDILDALNLGNVIAGLDLFNDLVGSLDFPALGAAVSGLSETLQNVFPFCMVFVIPMALDALTADAVAPSATVPLPDGCGGTVAVTVDLSDWEPVAQVTRSLSVVLFCLGLVFLTKQLLYGGGSE